MLAAACGHGPAAEPKASGTEARGLLERPATLPLDPTVKGPRFVPTELKGAALYGAEPDGARRGIYRGYRVLETEDGGVRASQARFTQDPSVVIPLPPRMGGGALFATGSTVFRAPYWLGEAEPVFLANGPITNLYVGLDRVYVRTGSGAHTAMNPRTGERMDLGPFPRSPNVGAISGRGFVTADAWRGAAIADFVGILLTTDAGETWKPVAAPFEPKELREVDGKIYASDGKKPPTFYEIRNDRTAAPLMSEPTPQRIASKEALKERTVFGRAPLEAAALEGWPLGDGTAVIARDGQLGRVRQDSGVLMDTDRRAFTLSPAHCKAIPLGDFVAKGSFGFVCAEPEGKTALYAFDPSRGMMVPVREWKKPRVILSSGNGAVAIRGGCDEDAAQTKDNLHRYCVMSPKLSFRDVDVRGDVGNERLVVLADGRVVIVTPPPSDGAGARLTILAGKDTKTVALEFPPVPSDVLRILRVGAWLDGMEETKPNEIGGWIEAAGVMLGIHVTLDGKVELGQYVRDAGTPMVSGRYGLGWTTGKRGYETADFGMTWTAIDVPDHDAVRTTAQGCSPLGCTGPGWLRIGWGAVTEAPRTPKLSTPRPPLSDGHRVVNLRCEALEPPPAPHKADDIVQNTLEPTIRSSHWPGVQAPVHSSSPWSSFYDVRPPALRTGERGFSQESIETIDRSARGMGPFARLYVTGPRTGDLDPSNARVQIRWLTPFGGHTDVRGTRATPAQEAVLEWWKMPGYMQHAFVAAEDENHGLLVSRRYSGSAATVHALESDHAPLQLKRADGEPFVEIDSALFAMGHWYFSTPAPAGDRPETIVWRADGAIVRELVHVRRAGLEGRPTGTRLTRRADGQSIGLLADGQPAPDGRLSLRWVLPIDVESGQLGEPESLGANDFSDRRALSPCKPFDEGWVIDLPWTASPRIRVGASESMTFQAQLVRARVTTEHACLELAAGTLSQNDETKRLLSRTSRAAPTHNNVNGDVRLSVLVDRMRYALRCTGE